MQARDRPQAVRRGRSWNCFAGSTSRSPRAKWSRLWVKAVPERARCCTCWLRSIHLRPGEVWVGGAAAECDVCPAGRGVSQPAGGAYVWQFHYLLPEFTALENVAMPLLASGTRQAEALSRARRWLGEVASANGPSIARASSRVASSNVFRCSCARHRTQGVAGRRADRRSRRQDRRGGFYPYSPSARRVRTDQRARDSLDRIRPPLRSHVDPARWIAGLRGLSLHRICTPGVKSTGLLV